MANHGVVVSELQLEQFDVRVLLLIAFNFPLVFELQLEQFDTCVLLLITVNLPLVSNVGILQRTLQIQV